MEDAARTIADLWRTSERKVIATLVRIVRDVGLAEDLAHEALVAALERWPAEGVPARPEAWLITTAKNRAFNAQRHGRVVAREADAVAHAIENVEPAADVMERELDEDIADDVLRLVFISCHPILSKEARVALTLRLVAGLMPDEIARAFLTTETAIQQRIVRAKKALADANIPFELPKNLAPRLASVLEVVYLVFNEGYYATAGEDVMRVGLQEEALRLGHLLAQLAPAEGEVHALVALMELTAARAAARTDAAGEPVLLADQDRSLWDRARMDRGLAALERSGDGAYALQARIAACHARAPTAGATDWRAIVALYDRLAALTPSPIVDLNRAIAVAQAEGPAAGLALLDALAENPALSRYPLLPAARAELLEKLGRREEARAAFLAAAALTDHDRQRARLYKRAKLLGL